MEELWHAYWDKTLTNSGGNKVRDAEWNAIVAAGRTETKAAGISQGNSTTDYITNERLGNYLNRTVQGYIAAHPLASGEFARLKAGDTYSAGNLKILRDTIKSWSDTASAQMGYDSDTVDDPAKLKAGRPGSKDTAFVEQYVFDKTSPLTEERILTQVGFVKTPKGDWKKP